MFIDTHAHINENMYDNILDVVNNAKQNNVYKVVNCSENIFTCKKILELGHTYSDFLYVALGIHPLNVDEAKDDDLSILEELIKNNKIVAIGEIGLDYHYSKDNKEKQIYYLKKQLDLADKYSLPVIIHSREATQDTIEILKEYKLKGIIHCFSGSKEIANEYIKMGYRLGIGGVLTFKNSKLGSVIKDIPLESIVLETDSPFLTPDPYRKYKNEPKYIPVIAEYLAGLKNISINEVANITTKNANEIFDF